MEEGLEINNFYKIFSKFYKGIVRNYLNVIE
jgi:hypothetical protein